MGRRKPDLLRLAFGMIAVVIIHQPLKAVFSTAGVGHMSDPGSYWIWILATESAFLLTATVVGGYVGRKGFILPATIYAGVHFLYGVYRGLELAATPGPILFAELDHSKIPFLLLALSAVVAVAAAGSAIGIRLASTTQSDSIRPCGRLDK